MKIQITLGFPELRRCRTEDIHQRHVPPGDITAIQLFSQYLAPLPHYAREVGGRNAVVADFSHKDDQYVLNQCTRFLARDSRDPRHNFDQYAPTDPRAAICEAWRFPIVDSHFDADAPEASYAFNDVTFVYDARAALGATVEVVGSFGPLYEPTPLRAVQFLGEDIGLRALSARIPKGQAHTYVFMVDGQRVVDPINPQQVVADNGRPWSRFYTDSCQIPLVLNRREREILGRLVTHLLPFRLPENSRFIRSVYNQLDGGYRQTEFPLAYKLDEEVGVVNYIDKVLARSEQHNADDYHTCLSLIDGLLRARNGVDPLQLSVDTYAGLYSEMATDRVDGWDTSRYGSPRFFLLLLRRHAMTGAFVHPKAGGNSGAAAWRYLQSRYVDPSGATLFDWQHAIERPLGDNVDYRG